MNFPHLPRVDTLAGYQRNESWRSDAAQSYDHPVMFWVTRGQGRFMIDCRLRGIGPNTLVFIPANTLFSFDLIAQPQGMVLALPIEKDAGFPKEPVILKVSTVQQQGELGGLIDAMSRELKQSQTGQRRAVQAHVMMLAVWIDRLLGSNPQSELGKSDQVLRKFSHFVSIGHREGKSLGEFAADLKVTPTHLTRLTQGSVGKPASTILQERVIHAACEALIQTDRPIQDIARWLGFGSAAYFTRAFQHHTGKSPSSFRKSAQ